MDRGWIDASMTLRCAGGVTNHTGCVTEDGLSTYKVSQRQDSPRLWESSVLHVSTTSSWGKGHSSLVHPFLALHSSWLKAPALPKQLAMCGCLNTKSLPIWKSVIWPLDAAEISQVTTWLVFSATKMTVWLNLITLFQFLCSADFTSVYKPACEVPKYFSNFMD